MQHIRDFHAENDYIVQVEKTEDKPGCLVRYPPNFLMRLPQLSKTYMLFDDPYSIEIYTLVNNQSVVRSVDVVVSNIRLLVIQDVFLTANARGMSKELIMTRAGVTLFEMLKIPQSTEEKELETQLCIKFRGLLEGDVVASDIEGYEQVLSCFENGGL